MRYLRHKLLLQAIRVNMVLAYLHTHNIIIGGYKEKSII